MRLSRNLKILIGVLTCWPVVYIFLFVAFIATTMFWLSGSPRRLDAHSSGPPIAFMVLMAFHLATMLSMFALTTFYIVYLFKTDRVAVEKKALWAVALFMGNMIAMPVFFYFYIWPDEEAARPPEVAGT